VFGIVANDLENEPLDHERDVPLGFGEIWYSNADMVDESGS
jgi:hypothetical protein